MQFDIYCRQFFSWCQTVLTLGVRSASKADAKLKNPYHVFRMADPILLFYTMYVYEMFIMAVHYKDWNI
jgi:hypothetical protein